MSDTYLAQVEANRLAAIEERDRLNAQPDGFHFADRDHEMAERKFLAELTADGSNIHSPANRLQLAQFRAGTHPSQQGSE